MSTPVKVHIDIEDKCDCKAPVFMVVERGGCHTGGSGGVGISYVNRIVFECSKCGQKYEF